MPTHTFLFRILFIISPEKSETQIDWYRRLAVMKCDSYFFLLFIWLFVIGGKKPVEHHAAVWVPDNEANVCMHCKRTQFTMLVRRVSSRHFNTFAYNHFSNHLISLFCLSFFVSFVIFAASLPKLWSGSLWAVLIEKILAAATEYKAITCLLRLLWFAQPIEKWTGNLIERRRRRKKTF